MLRLELHVSTTASRAEHLAVRPTPGNHVIAAILRVGEVDYRFLKGGGFGCHDYSVPDLHGIVTYIYTNTSTPSRSSSQIGFVLARPHPQPHSPNFPPTCWKCAAAPVSILISYGASSE